MENLLDFKLDGSDIGIDTGAIADTLQTVMVVLTALGVLIVVLYVLHLVQTMRVNRAILQMQKDLRELNERDKLRSPAVPNTIQRSPDVVESKQIN